jgi:hypothetical protein
MSQNDLVVIQIFSLVVQAISSIALVVVTVWSVWLSRKISLTSSESARIAREAAETSKHSLEEMEMQRLSAAQPLLVPRVGQIRTFDTVPEAIEIDISNVGNGPSLNIIASLQMGNTTYKTSSMSSLPIQFLSPNSTSSIIQFQVESRQVTQLMQAWANPIQGKITVTYSDIFGRNFQSLTQVSYNKVNNTSQLSGLNVYQVEVRS